MLGILKSALSGRWLEKRCITSVPHLPIVNKVLLDWIEAGESRLKVSGGEEVGVRRWGHRRAPPENAGARRGGTRDGPGAKTSSLVWDRGAEGRMGELWL